MTPFTLGVFIRLSMGGNKPLQTKEQLVLLFALGVEWKYIFKSLLTLFPESRAFLMYVFYTFE